MRNGVRSSFQYFVARDADGSGEHMFFFVPFFAGQRKVRAAHSIRELRFLALRICQKSEYLRYMGLILPMYSRAVCRPHAQHHSWTVQAASAKEFLVDSSLFAPLNFVADPWEGQNQDHRGKNCRNHSQSARRRG